MLRTMGARGTYFNAHVEDVETGVAPHVLLLVEIAHHNLNVGFEGAVTEDWTGEFWDTHNE